VGGIKPSIGTVLERLKIDGVYIYKKSKNNSASLSLQNEPGAHRRVRRGRGRQDDASRHVSRKRRRPGQRHQPGAGPLQDSGPAVDHQRPDHGHHHAVSVCLLIHIFNARNG